MRWPVMMNYHRLWPSMLVIAAASIPWLYAQEQFDLDDV